MKIVINPEYKELKEFIDTLPEIFETSGEVIYHARNVLKRFQYGGYSINVKSFQRPNIVNQIAYRFFRRSKAKRSFLYANRILKHGVGTPDPIAYIEIPRGALFDRSYYVSIHEDVQGTIRDLFFSKEPLDNVALEREFIEFTAQMHINKVYHKDYSAGNILYQKIGENYSFMLVDLNRMRFGQVNLRAGCESFRRLIFNSRQLELISQEYASARGFDSTECYARIKKANEKFWERYRRRHA